MAPPNLSIIHNVLPRLLSRDLGDTVEKATGIHDWNSCMAHGYCKWPVIIGIIVLSLILLSILFCCLRCCGICVDCCRCLSCCCGGRSRDKTKYVQAPQPHAPPMYPPQGYGFQPHMAYGAGSTPQFATFESSKSPSKIHADSLPAMPSWSTARSRQVEDTSEPPEEETKPLRNAEEHGHGEDIAMAQLTPSGHSPQSPQPNYSRGEGYNQSQYASHDANPGAGVGMAYGGAYNDHDHNRGYDDHNSYGQQAQGYGRQQQGYDQQQQQGYGQREQGYGQQPEGYGAGYAGYRSPRAGQRHPGQRPPGQRQPNPYGPNAGNPYAARSPISPMESNYGAGYPPPSYRTQPPSRAYTPADGLDRYGSQGSRAASSDYASTVGYQGGFSQQQQQQPRHEDNYSSPVAEMPTTRMSHKPPAASGQSSYPQELDIGGGPPPQNQMPASLQPGGGAAGAWRSAGQRGGFDRKPVTGSWREV